MCYSLEASHEVQPIFTGRELHKHVNIKSRGSLGAISDSPLPAHFHTSSKAPASSSSVPTLLLLPSPLLFFFCSSSDPTYIIMLGTVGRNTVLIGKWTDLELHYFIICLKNFKFPNVVKEMRKQPLTPGSWPGITRQALVSRGYDLGLRAGPQCSSIACKHFTGHRQTRPFSDSNRARVRRPLSQPPKWPAGALSDWSAFFLFNWLWLIMSDCCFSKKKN